MSTKAAVSAVYNAQHEGAITIGGLYTLAVMLVAAEYDIDTVVYPWLDEENQQWCLETVE